jgi:uncharacterized protein (UPF0548 family)
MRLLRPSTARAMAFDCQYWQSRGPNVDPARRDGVHDHYSVPIPQLPADGGEAFRRAAEHLLRYRIFAPGRMLHCRCGVGSTLNEGDTIVQRIFVAGLAIEAGVRVVEVRREPERVGFSYVTLEGHVERGVASFSVVREPERELSFQIESWSTPSVLTTWLAPGVARYFQRKSVAEALDSFVRQVVSGPPPNV